MDVGKLGKGEQLAAAGGLLLIVSYLIFDWYGVPDLAVPGFGDPDLGGASFGALTGGFAKLLFWLIALVAVGSAVVKAAEQSLPTLPVSLGTIVSGLGGLGVALVVIRLINPPGNLDRGFGLFVALVGACLVAFGGSLTMKSEGTSFGAEADKLQDRFDGGDSGGSAA